MTPAYQSSCVFPFLLICFHVSSSRLGTRMCGTAIHLVPCLSLFSSHLLSISLSSHLISYQSLSLLISSLINLSLTASYLGRQTNLAATIIATVQWGSVSQCGWGKCQLVVFVNVLSSTMFA